MDVDHYQVLGLSSSSSEFIDCTKLTEAEIKAAYRKKALELHPDTFSRKRKRDPANDNNNADVNSMTSAFQQLQSSYEVLMNKESRKKFDAVWLRQNKTKYKAAKEKEKPKPKERKTVGEFETKLRMRTQNMMRLARQLDEMVKARKEKERRERMEREEDERKRKEAKMREEEEEQQRREKEAVKKIQEEERRVHDKLFGKISNRDNIRVLEHVWMMKAKTLKVFWNKSEYGKFSEIQIRDMFDCFGEVKDVTIDSNNGEALVVMGCRDSVAAASVASWVNHPNSPFFVSPLTLC